VPKSILYTFWGIDKFEKEHCLYALENIDSSEWPWRQRGNWWWQDHVMSFTRNLSVCALKDIPYLLFLAVLTMCISLMSDVCWYSFI